ncbi:hypothetical protein [Nocardia colli]|uniref:hypothetical protein n=1 Tax=Nocardia colli TaxID=2545717 RepID=UPI0035DD5066
MTVAYPEPQDRMTEEEFRALYGPLQAEITANLDATIAATQVLEAHAKIAEALRLLRLRWVRENPGVSVPYVDIGD